MKYTLRQRLTIIFTLFIAAALLTIGVVHWFFIDDFYFREKLNALENCYSYLDGQSESNEFTDNYCQTNNITYIITNENFELISSNVRDEERMMTQLFGFIVGMEDDHIKVIEEKDNMTIARFDDNRRGTSFLQLTGRGRDGSNILLQTPLESIEQAASVSNRFYIIVGIIVIIVFGFLLRLITRKLTARVVALTDMSEKMAKLDFEVKYDSKGIDEIDILGENFNKMSDSLKESITELKNANVRLAHDIEEKTEQENQRREFLSNVSHELKTPIALIQGYAEGIKEMDLDKESREMYLDVITDEAKKMNKLVMQLLTLEHLESGKDALDIQRFDLTELINGVISASALMSEQAGVKVIFKQEDSIFVWADEFKIEQVLTNFLTNAIHYADGEKIVEIRCRKENGLLKTSIFNTGAPIPEDSIDKIWDKFYKVDKARTRAYGGSGIGLSIVKAIMDLHGQKCGVTNYDNGVAFYFTLEENAEK